MLAKRVIPTLLARGNQLVKGQGYDSWRSIGVALQAARTHAMRSVDELIVLDIGATPGKRGPNLKMVEDLTANCYIPVTVGGGIRTLDDVRNLLSAGADKVCIGTASLETPEFIRECADRFGSQAIAVSIDVKEGDIWGRCGQDRYFLPPATWATVMQSYGAGEIILNSIERDGTMRGYDLDLIKEVSDAVDIPVVAAGGCSGPEDMRQALLMGASAVSAGALFAFSDETPKSCADYLRKRGIEVRI